MLKYYFYRSDIEFGKCIFYLEKYKILTFPAKPTGLYHQTSSQRKAIKKTRESNSPTEYMSARHSLNVLGFNFPLRYEDEIEQLEALVISNQQIHDHYIRYLTYRKEHDESITSAITRIFTDKALENYTYHGLSSPQYSRKAMKDYLIFTDCMLAAWGVNGLTKENLKNALVKATQRAKQHLSSARYYQRYRSRLLEKRKEHKHKK